MLCRTETNTHSTSHTVTLDADAEHWLAVGMLQDLGGTFSPEEGGGGIQTHASVLVLPL